MIVTISGRPGGAGRGGGSGRSSGAGRSDRSDGEISLVPLIAGALIGAGILAVIYFHTQKSQSPEVPEVPTVIETPRPRKICYRRSNVCPKISLKRRRFLTKEEEQELNRQLQEEQEKLMAEQEERKKLEEKSKIKSFGKFFCLPENSDKKEDCDLEEESA
ncbi:uncharacterized protein LOC124632677 [Helicoverpa zea]|uniref:uncharacterized protein LOC124632677 n=1 Tax=Helicoverpa zea TaxID=7113 RepID=UPI001F5639C9|nr:uncharacterized protein LOC124632677 [Helicoverpa zea]